MARVHLGRDVYKVLMGKPEGKRPLGRPRLMREDNNKFIFRKREGLRGLDGVGSG
jgi:hypothetical protein